MTANRLTARGNFWPAGCGLAKTAASEKSLAGKPGRVFRGQKDSDGGDIIWLADAAEWGLREGGLFELRSDPAAAVGALSLDYAGTDGVDPDLLRAKLAGQHASDGVDGSLSAGVNRAVRRCDAANNGAHVYDAASLSQVLHSGLRRKEEAQHVLGLLSPPLDLLGATSPPSLSFFAFAHSPS